MFYWQDGMACLVYYWVRIIRLGFNCFTVITTAFSFEYILIPISI